ncbi:hypothetical protein RJ55_02775 [Drechmeria coniospora]|nr:hypothetical protein RJ55_02775 [Drechmeria coniospora]
MQPPDGRTDKGRGFLPKLAQLVGRTPRRHLRQLSEEAQWPAGLSRRLAGPPPPSQAVDRKRLGGGEEERGGRGSDDGASQPALGCMGCSLWADAAGLAPNPAKGK